MAKIPLQAESIEKLSDGFVGKLLDRAFRQMYEDIKDRGEDRLVRKLTLSISVKPDGHGYVTINPKVELKLPALVPPDTKARLDMVCGGLVFNPDVSNNPDAKSFADMMDENGEIKE